MLYCTVIVVGNEICLQVLGSLRIKRSLATITTWMINKTISVLYIMNPTILYTFLEIVRLVYILIWLASKACAKSLDRRKIDEYPCRTKIFIVIYYNLFYHQNYIFSQINFSYFVTNTKVYYQTHFCINLINLITS